MIAQHLRHVVSSEDPSLDPVTHSGNPQTPLPADTGDPTLSSGYYRYLYSHTHTQTHAHINTIKIQSSKL